MAALLHHHAASMRMTAMRTGDAAASSQKTCSTGSVAAAAIGRFNMHGAAPMHGLSSRRALRHAVLRQQRLQPLYAVADKPAKEGGTGLIERPDLDLAEDAKGPETDFGSGAEDFDKSKKLGGGNYRVLLLDDKKHTEDLVVKVLTRVVPEVDDDKARNCFATSRTLGVAVIISALKEHAEHYASQIFRQGVRSSIEPDSTTI